MVYVKNLHHKNFRTLKIYGRINIVKMAILPKVIYTFNATSHQKFDQKSLQKLRKQSSVSHGKTKYPSNSLKILNNKSIVGSITTQDFKKYYGAIKIKRT